MPISQDILSRLDRGVSEIEATGYKGSDVPDSRGTPPPSTNWLSDRLDTGVKEIETGKKTLSTPGISAEKPVPDISKPKKFGFMEKWREVKKEGIVPFIPFVSGAKEVKDIAHIASAAHRLDKGEATDEERADLLEFVQEANKDTTFGYKVLDVVTAMPAFMGEFLATGGIYAAGRKIGTKAATGAIKKYLGKTGEELLKKKVGKVGIKIAGGVTGATLQTPFMGGPRIVKGTIERSLPKLRLSESERGDLGVLIAGEGEDLLPATLKSLGDQWAETVSEHSGGFFGILGKEAKNAVIKSGLLSAFVKANPSKAPNKAISAFRKMGYHGVLNEMAEERLGEVLRAGIGVQEYSLPTIEQLGVELVSFSVPGVVQGLGARAFKDKDDVDKLKENILSNITAKYKEGKDHELAISSVIDGYKGQLFNDTDLEKISKEYPELRDDIETARVYAKTEIVKDGLSEAIESGLTTGELDGQPFTEDNALDFIRQGVAGDIFTKEDIEGFKEKYPGLRSGLNILIAVQVEEEVQQAFSPELAKSLKGMEALPPGQGFELVEPKPEIKVRPRDLTYLKGQDYVAGEQAPEDLEVEYKPILRKTVKGDMPWRTRAGAENALKSDKFKDKGVSLATHKVVAVKGGFQIINIKGKGEAPDRGVKKEEKGSLLSWVRAMGGIGDKTLLGEQRALHSKESGVVGLVSKKGTPFDEMANLAVDEGWISKPEDFMETLQNDIFAQKEGKPRAQRLIDIAARVEVEEQKKEFDRAEAEEQEYLAAQSEIRRLDEKRAKEIEESTRNEVENENPDLEGLKEDEGFAEFIENWSEKEALDKETLAELETWRAGQKEKPEVAEEKPEVAEEKPEVAEEKPEVAEEKPEVAEEKPEVAEEKPEVAEEKPEVTEARATEAVSQIDLVKRYFEETGEKIEEGELDKVKERYPAEWYRLEKADADKKELWDKLSESFRRNRGINEYTVEELEEKIAKPVEAKPEVEDPISSLLSSKKKAGVKYEMKMMVSETGETVTVTKDAGVALRETKEELDKMNKFLECLI